MELRLPGLQLSERVRVKTHHRALCVFLWGERHPAGDRQEDRGGCGGRTLVLLLDALVAKVKGHIPL